MDRSDLRSCFVSVESITVSSAYTCACSSDKSVEICCESRGTAAAETECFHSHSPGQTTRS